MRKRERSEGAASVKPEGVISYSTDSRWARERKYRVFELASGVTNKLWHPPSDGLSRACDDDELMKDQQQLRTWLFITANKCKPHRKFRCMYSGVTILHVVFPIPAAQIA